MPQRWRVKARLHAYPRLINAVESRKLNSTVERYCLHSSTKVSEAVDFKMAANELVREGVVVICDCLMKESQYILEKKKYEGKTRRSTRSTLGTGRDLLVDTGNLWWVIQRETTTSNESWPSPSCSPVNTVDHFRWKELFTKFILVDSTVMINLGDPCKRALKQTDHMVNWALRIV